jgi:hypothetical protein
VRLQGPPRRQKDAGSGGLRTGAGIWSPVTGHRSPVSGHRSPVTANPGDRKPETGDGFTVSPSRTQPRPLPDRQRHAQRTPR